MGEIKKCRKSKGMTQDQLAITINVKRSTISKWEHGENLPRSNILSKLAEVLDTTIDKILKNNETEVNNMRWHMIWVDVGKEDKALGALKEIGAEVLKPCKTKFFKHSGKLQLLYMPLMPGYVIAKLDVTDFYKYNRDHIINLGNNMYNATILSDVDALFIKSCCEGMPPITLQKRNNTSGRMSDKSAYDIVDPPQWAQNAEIEWYDITHFIAKLHVNMEGVLKDHTFTVAAYSLNYNGYYRQQIIDLIKMCAEERLTGD